MFTSKRPGHRRGVEGWDYVRLEVGKRWYGYRAGPTVGIYTHHDHGTRACRSDLTGGALKCPYCELAEGREADQWAKVWRGYVPLWDEGGIRHVIIIGERYFDLSEEVSHLAPCVVTKVAGRGSPLRIDPRPADRGKPRLSPGDEKPQDLTAWMLRIWKDAELEAWVRAHPQRSAAASASRKKPDMYTAAHVRAEVTAEVLKRTAEPRPASDAVNEAFAAAVRRNGKPPKGVT